MNDEQLGVALRDALTAPELTADRWAGQQLRRRAQLRRDAQRSALVAMSFVVVAVLAIGGVVGLVRAGSGGSDTAATAAGGGLGTTQPLPLVRTVTAVTTETFRSCGGVQPTVSPGPGTTAQSAACLSARSGLPTITAVLDIRLVQQDDAGGAPRVELRLSPGDAAGLAAYAGMHPGKDIAFLVNGQETGRLILPRAPDGPVLLTTVGAGSADRVFRLLTEK